MGTPSVIRLRALQQWDENGFDELSVGLIECVLGGSLLLVEWLSATRLWGSVMPVLGMAVALPIALTIKKLRARLVYPRTGYVVFRSPVSRKWIFLSLLAFGALLTVVDCLWRSTTMPDLSRAWGPAWGLVFAATFAGAIRYQMPRYLWIAGLAMVLGGATFAAGAKAEGTIWVMLGTGVAMASEGTLRLKRFLRTHPVIEGHRG